MPIYEIIFSSESLFWPAVASQIFIEDKFDAQLDLFISLDSVSRRENCENEDLEILIESSCLIIIKKIKKKIGK